MYSLYSLLFLKYLLFIIQTVNSEQNETTSTTNNNTNQKVTERKITVTNQTSNEVRKFDVFKPSVQISGNLYTNQQSKTIDLPPIDDWSSWNKKYDETSIQTPWRYSKIKFPNEETNYQTYPSINPTVKPQSMWNKFMSFTGLNNPSSKSFYNDHLEPNTYIYHGNNLEHHPHYIPKEHYHPVEPYGGSISPWKKILKVLATIVPLGLLLGALTPTIITVTPTNETESRFNRKNDAVDTIMDKVANSLNTLQKLQQDGCEQKVFCELLVNAMLSKNAEEHIKNLLDNFVKRSGINETSFMKVLEAVKNQNCSSIICRIVKDPT
ncbi:uncharacterized protein LOC130902039 [Diorhabda carinulata]|uniref:uncharacterized protein LOC130902039 n=1 Tax=Diorhabda carinulata TaxID=1163345 RepID=UPI0025A2EEB2|nr:uncharacterized protein LOC130902039 [Diorhabda carinulata]